MRARRPAGRRIPIIVVTNCNDAGGAKYRRAKCTTKSAPQSQKCIDRQLSGCEFGNFRKIQTVEITVQLITFNRI